MCEHGAQSGPERRHEHVILRGTQSRSNQTTVSDPSSPNAPAVLVLVHPLDATGGELRCVLARFFRSTAANPRFGSIALAVKLSTPPVYLSGEFHTYGSRSPRAWRAHRKRSYHAGILSA